MKSEDTSSASQYANAILQLAEISGSAETVQNNLEILCQVIEKEPLFSVLLKHPAISAPDKKKLLKDIFSASLDELSQRLLEMLCDRRKMHLLPSITSEFKNLLKEKNNILSGTLVCAENMTSESIELIRQKLIKNFRKHVELEVVVDRSLIGGYTLKMGDQVIDGSLKGRLASIEKVLLSV